MKEGIKPKNLQRNNDRRKGSSPSIPGRRDFLRCVIFGGGVVVTRGMLQFQEAPQQVTERERPPGAPPSLKLPPGRASMIVVDLRKCTGCRTCEVECAKHNQHLYSGKGNPLGLGNPDKARIWVHYFNPPVDVPNFCLQCADRPCIEACPVTIDFNKEIKNLHLNEKTQTLVVGDQCISCFSCVSACYQYRNGSLRADAELRIPVGYCTLCDGDPVCVMMCPHEALAHVAAGLDKYYARRPELAAKEVAEHWYGSR
ncbi:MAG: 4Fe-4S dicluster domain-containing protein [Acidobacteriota bacterium]